MSDESDGVRPDLLTRISTRRASIDDYLGRARPRGNRLVVVAVVSSAVAAVLTAGPAIGGESFTETVAAGLNLPSTALVWRGLCLLALAVSVVAAVTTNLARSLDTERKIVAAESANAELEGLMTALEFGQAPVADVVEQYRQCVATIPWVDEHRPVTAGAGAPPPRAASCAGPSPGGAPSHG